MNKSKMLFIMLFLVASSASGQKLQAEEVIAKHLDSIAPAEKRASIKSFIAVGEVLVEYLTQKNQPASGRIVIASEGTKMFFGMRLNASDYPQDKFIFDGSKVDIGLVRPGTRSPLGAFIQSNTLMISQGLLSGSLSTAWPLLSSAGRGYKISSAGNKKIDGKDVYAISFRPKGTSDVDVTMYFDSQTFQHVRTIYNRTSSASMGRTPETSSQQTETRLKITEDFSDFKAYEGLTVPSKYKIVYSVSGVGGTTEISWTSVFSEFAINQPLDPGTFAMGK